MLRIFVCWFLRWRWTEIFFECTKCIETWLHKFQICGRFSKMWCYKFCSLNATLYQYSFKSYITEVSSFTFSAGKICSLRWNGTRLTDALVKFLNQICILSHIKLSIAIATDGFVAKFSTFFVPHDEYMFINLLCHEVMEMQRAQNVVFAVTNVENVFPVVFLQLLFMTAVRY